MQRAKSITSSSNGMAGVAGSGMHRAKSQGNCAALVKGGEDAQDSKDLAQRLASLDPDSLNHRLLEDLEEPVTPPSNNKAAKVASSDVKLLKFVECGAAGNWSMISAAAQTRFYDKNEDHRGKDSEWYLEIKEGGINERTDSTLNYVVDAKQRRVTFAAAGALWSLRFPTQEVYTAFVTELEDDVFLNSSGRFAGARGDSKKITKEMIGEPDALEVCVAPCKIHEGEAGAPPLEVPTEAASPRSPTYPFSPSVVHFTPAPAARQGEASTTPAMPSRLSPFAAAGNGTTTSPANGSSAHSVPISIGPSSSLQKPAAVGSPLNPERAGSKILAGPNGPDSPRTRGSYAESALAKKVSLQCQLSATKSAQLAACEVTGSVPTGGNSGGVLTSRTSLAQLLVDCQPDSATSRGSPAVEFPTSSSSSSSDGAACGPTTPAGFAASIPQTAAAAAAPCATSDLACSAKQVTEQHPSKSPVQGANPTTPVPGSILAALGTSPALAQAWTRLSAGPADSARVMASTLALAQAWPKKGALVSPGSSSGGDSPKACESFPAQTGLFKKQAGPWARVVGSNALAVLVIVLGGLRPVVRVANSLLWAVGLLVVLLISYVAAMASYNI